MKLTEELMKQLYIECWNKIKSEDEQYKDIEMPKFYAHNKEIPVNALACYNSKEHTVSIGETLWGIYQNEMSERNIQEIKDVFFHELAHILHHDHEDAFWEQTHKFDSTGAKIRKFRESQRERLMKRFEEAKARVECSK